MKYRKRSIIYVLVAGLMALINSCNTKVSPEIELVHYKILDDFPSASAIEYHSGKLYVFGDDAPYLLIMDTAYNKKDSVLYSIDTSYRMVKATKPDIESAAIIEHNNEKHLYGLGSLSSEARSRLFYFPLSDPHTYLSIDYRNFARQLQKIREINIEGLAMVQSDMVFANRANKSYRANHLIVANSNPNEWKNFPPRIIEVLLDSTTVKGLSGLFYFKEKDLLLFTASEEDTPSATDDGAIQDSYLGFISRFSHQMVDSVVRPDALIRLSSIHPAFKRQKIESVCVEKSNQQEIIIHLVSDNDNGQSGLFKCRVIL